MTKFEERESHQRSPMSPEKLSEQAPTAVQRNPNHQRIVEKGETGVDSPEAKEKLRKSGMTKT